MDREALEELKTLTPEEIENLRIIASRAGAHFKSLRNIGGAFHDHEIDALIAGRIVLEALPKLIAEVEALRAEKKACASCTPEMTYEEYLAMLSPPALQSGGSNEK